MNASRGLLLAAALAAAFTQCSVDQDGYRFDDGSDGGTSGDGAGGASGDSAGGTTTTGGQDSSGGDTGAAGAGGTAGGDGAGGTGNGAGSAGEGQGGTPTTGGSAGAANGGSAGTGAETSGGEAGAGGVGGVGGAGGDGSGGVAGATGFCAGRTRPAGVAATDYDCFSFEPGLPSNTVWKPPTSLGMATSMLSTARAVSLPNSWFVTVPSAASAMPSQSTLARSFVGATEITTVVISADISLVSPVGVTPAWTGSVDLLCLDTGSGETCVSYTEGGNTEFQSPYSGIYVSETYVGGPAFIRDCKVTGTIATGTWTRVELRSVMKGQTTVLLNGTNGAATCSLTYLVDSAAEVRVGLASHPTTGRALSAYFDNVEAYVIR